MATFVVWCQLHRFVKMPTPRRVLSLRPSSAENGHAEGCFGFCMVPGFTLLVWLLLCSLRLDGAWWWLSGNSSWIQVKAPIGFPAVFTRLDSSANIGKQFRANLVQEGLLPAAVPSAA